MEVSRLLLDLDFYGGTGPLGMFPLLLKRTADVLALVSVWYSDGYFVGVATLLAGDWLMSP